MLDRIVPKELSMSTGPCRAIIVATSFDSWRHLRQDEELSASETVDAIKDIVSEIISRVENKPDGFLLAGSNPLVGT